MGSDRSTLRRDAFAKLATLSLRTPAGSHESDLQKLTQSLPQAKPQPNGYLDGVLRAIAPTSRVPMSMRELDLLLALCATAPQVTRATDAERLVSQLSSYLPEAHSQLFTHSPYLSDVKPSPWAVVTYQLTKALLTLGIRFVTLKATVAEAIQSYLNNWSQSAVSFASQDYASQGEETESEAKELAAVAVSMVGFMEAAALHENFWDPFERLQLIRAVKDALSDAFLLAVESASSAIRHSSSEDSTMREWKKYLKRYAAKGSPLGAMLIQRGFMRLVLSCTARMLCDEDTVQCGDLLDQYIGGTHLDRADVEGIDDDMIEYLAEIVSEQMRVLEDGSDYLQLSSAWQQKLAFSVKGYALEAFLHCMVLDEDIADAEVLFGWLEDAINSQIQMADLDLADVVLKSFAVVAKYMPESASNYARILLRFIVQGTSRPSVVAVAAQSLSHILRQLSQDAIITTLYSLGNILSSQASAEKGHTSLTQPQEANGHHNSLVSAGRLRTGSVISLSISGDEETSLVCGNVAHAIVMVATSCKDSKITALAQMMLLQKIGRVSLLVDARIIEETAKLAIHGKESEFKALLRLQARLHHDAVQQNNTVLFESVRKAREYLALHLNNKSSLFKIFASHLLEVLLSKGDVIEGEFKQSAEVEQAAKEIAPLLRPMSLLVTRKAPADSIDAIEQDQELMTLVRESWFNIAVHGITLQSRIGQQYYHELRILAMSSPPLVDIDRAELLESDVELSTVLRRGMSTQHTSDQKKSLTSMIPDRESDIRHLSYQKIVYLNAVYLVESLRAISGECAEILEYFADPTLEHSELGKCLSSMAYDIVRRYTLKVIAAKELEFSAPYVAKQLAGFFSGCCHRSQKMQEVANASAETIISAAPSALIQKAALFALLELLTLMWSSCLEEDIDEYEWKPTMTSARGKITVELSDDYSFRKRTLNNLYMNARRWVTMVITIAPLDVKGLLQTYLSEYDDTGAYGHVSLGRSFALEMGSLIPPLDQRLAAIDRKGEFSINVASDFIAQYTTRQEYRFAGIPDHGRDDVKADAIGIRDGTSSATKSVAEITHDAEKLLKRIQVKTEKRALVPTAELKDVLRRAAALLCTSKRSQTAIVHYLVNIPFEIFSKDSIKLGISLWLGVIHENPRMEPRILTEVAQAWERTIKRKVGIFSPQFHHPDPFYVKEEFAPSDKEALMKQIQRAQNTIAPNARVMQFFQSHFNAIRLGSVNTQRTFVRALDKTLVAFSQLAGHPLLREVVFGVVHFALRLLKFSTCVPKISLWKFRDMAISVGLHWFSFPPAWSFGGNRLQMKAEIEVMQEVITWLQETKAIGNSTSSNRKDPAQKQQLLEHLLNNEITRLNVWLKPRATTHHSSHSQNTQMNTYARTAWNENPSLAIQLLARYAQDALHRDVRFLLLNFPEKALNEPNAVDLLLGDSLPQDVSFQLKYLLFWSPVNPVQAVTYFMPGFGNHPFVLQYAIRALESHSVDVTFFYVPQIVQCLRYDALGYVEQYIIETGKFSQLFAHQIIWNMNANAYKDDDATIEDELKPTLDRVTTNLTSSFSGADREFYEREFAFFGEVTGISGKLKPFIKKSKPEKKQKIEEELRKIKVEVGVYLPSNPDGVVVGIDRKSGKPLQSHAKAPYMATFRIRKQRGDDSTDDIADMAERAQQREGAQRPKPRHNRSTSQMSVKRAVDSDPNNYDIWQSAIFKVGDDCRQDILALQMIAAFRGIFNSVGLDVYVYPYRVTATAPGCGVIDVLPNSISRDMLGREAVNGLHEYFIAKYGGEHSVRYQEARSEFVKSMAAYSVISYLMQFKDRHNGNIMIDDKGHILHIDFGFCFDISPGGVRFERAPFKLTEEMIAVLGGPDSEKSQSYRWFEELTIKAFLCSRQYSAKLMHLVSLMLDSGLPCFKPETMKNFKDRFVLEKDEGEAARFMLASIKRSEANVTTKVYDEFQLLTNGIPY